MSYLIDKFDTPRMYQATLSTSPLVVVGAAVPFNAISGDSGVTVSSGVLTLTGGLYAVMGQVLFSIEATTSGWYLNGSLLGTNRSEQASTFASGSTSSNNQTATAVFRARDGDTLELRLISAAGDSSACQGSDCDITLLRMGAS